MPTVAKGKKFKGIPSWKSREIINKGGEIIDEILPASCDSRGGDDVHEEVCLFLVEFSGRFPG